MTASRERDRLDAEQRILAWLEKNPGRWWRIPDIAEGARLSIPATTCTMARFESMKVVMREIRRKKRNGKRVPYYVFRLYGLAVPDVFTGPNSAPPAWLCPMPPTLTKEQIKGVRTVLGFTGDVEIVKRLRDEDID